MGSLTLLFLQSVTWSSGLMFLSAPSLLLAYLFSSLNTAQALLITILHCTLARKVCLIAACRHPSVTAPVVYNTRVYPRQGQKDYSRCLRLSQCCVTSSSSSPDSVKGAALRSNSRYTSSQSRRATANRQVRLTAPHLRNSPPTPGMSRCCPDGEYFFQSRIRRMWNDTVRRQTESSFIAADINNTPTLNRGNDGLFFVFFSNVSLSCCKTFLTCLAVHVQLL